MNRPWKRLPRGPAALSILLLATCGSPFDATLDQGIEGQAVLGPVCPVEQQDDPCPDEPYQAWIRILNPSGILVLRLQTDEDGQFRVGLPPSRYRLVPENGDPFPVAEGQEVLVPRGEFVTVTLRFDTGIR